MNVKRRLLWITILALVLTWISTVTVFAAEGDGAGHGDPIAPILLALLAILAVAKIGGELFERLGQPAVLGELVGGVVLGNLVLLNPSWSFFEPLRVAAINEHWAIVIDGLARLGVVILLFEVGLESTVGGMMKVGASSFVVAIVGVITPMILGFAASWFFIKELPAELAAIVPPNFSLNYIHLFMGAVLTATSVGITARVFKDLKVLRHKEAQIVLGAAVIDDVLGLLVLALVSGVITAAQVGQGLNVTALLQLVGIAMLFLVGSVGVGIYLFPRLLRQLGKMRTSGVMLSSALVIGFLLAYLANLSGLAAIVGAFAAGLILEEGYFRHFHEAEEMAINHYIRPLGMFLIPIFFVLMGIQVRLETFADPAVLGVAAALTLAAVVGKQVCGLAVLEKGLDRLTVGVGMIPRGEVGLIFASVGKGLKVVNDATFSAIVIMVIVTTVITPPLLKLTLARWARRNPAPAPVPLSSLVNRNS